jgi:hypothetical protein
LTRPDVYRFGVCLADLVKPETTEFGEKGDIQGEGDVIGPLVLEGAPCRDSFSRRDAIMMELSMISFFIRSYPADTEMSERDRSYS